MDEREWQEFYSRLDDLVSGFIGRMGKKMSLVFENDITPGQFVLLRTLGLKGPCRVGELAERMGTSMSAISAAVDRMHQQGWVQRRRDTKDRRQVWIHLTPRGEKKLAEVKARRAAIARRYAAALTEKEREALLAIFQRLAEIDREISAKEDAEGDDAKA